MRPCRACSSYVYSACSRSVLCRTIRRAGRPRRRVSTALLAACLAGMSRTLLHVMHRLANWDGVYFNHISIKGYMFEQVSNLLNNSVQFFLLRKSLLPRFMFRSSPSSLSIHTLSALVRVFFVRGYRRGSAPSWPACVSATPRLFLQPFCSTSSPARYPCILSQAALTVRCFVTRF